MRLNDWGRLVGWVGGFLITLAVLFVAIGLAMLGAAFAVWVWATYWGA